MSAQTFPYRSIEFVTGKPRGGRIRQIQGLSPLARHSRRKLFRSTHDRKVIGLPGIETSNERSNRGSSDHVNGYSCFFQGSYYANVGQPASSPASENESYGFPTDASCKTSEITSVPLIHVGRRGFCHSEPSTLESLNRSLEMFNDVRKCVLSRIFAKHGWHLERHMDMVMGVNPQSILQPFVGTARNAIPFRVKED